MDKSAISWTETTWNPVTGCTKISPGCDHCYAHDLAERYRGQKAFPVGFDVQLRPHKVREPVGWKKPRLIFVNSMSDLFHRDIPDDYLAAVWSTMIEADQHVYQVLTKRPHRARAKIQALGLTVAPHIWLGVSAENQVMLDSRMPALLDIAVATPWISAEPLLGPLDLTQWLPYLKWVVDGGESGPRRRPAALDWFRSLRDQCLAAEVPYYHKQGNNRLSGRDVELDGVVWHQYPVAMPSHLVAAQGGSVGPAYRDPPEAEFAATAPRLF